jgi:hypothetical protein
LEEKVSDLLQKYRNKTGHSSPNPKFIFNAKILNPDLTCAEAGISNKSNVYVIETKGIKGAGGPWLMKEINIKF